MPARSGRAPAGGEAAFIARHFAALTRGHPAARGLADDCAVLTPSPGEDLVLTTDSLVEGVHFLPGDAPGFKALAVNASDLVAKGATPFGYLLTLALPDAADETLVRRLTAGLAEAQDAFGCVLLGGDTDVTPGPLTLTVAAFGSLPSGTAVSRGGARPGDRIVTTGTIGDAALGLALRKDDGLAEHWGLQAEAAAYLRSRFDAPVPRLPAAALVREFASAALDVSDGLIKDAERLAEASGCQVRIEAARVPLSPPARAALDTGHVGIATLLTGGEDYEVLAAVPQTRLAALLQAAGVAGVPLSIIGDVTHGRGVSVVGRDGEPLRFERSGWDHFG